LYVCPNVSFLLTSSMGSLHPPWPSCMALKMSASSSTLTRSPVQMSSGPGNTTFQRLMDEVLRGLEGFSAAYIDDVVIFSTTWEDHLKAVRSVLGRLRQAGLTAKPRKCQFGMKECTYLGHVVGGGVVKPHVSKLEAVASFPVPKTKKEVRTFLGLSGYYRKFIPGYAGIAIPLTDLTRKSAPTTSQTQLSQRHRSWMPTSLQISKLQCSQSGVRLGTSLHFYRIAFLHGVNYDRGSAS